MNLTEENLFDEILTLEDRLHSIDNGETEHTRKELAFLREDISELRSYLCKSHTDATAQLLLGGMVQYIEQSKGGSLGARITLLESALSYAKLVARKFHFAL